MDVRKAHHAVRQRVASSVRDVKAIDDALDSSALMAIVMEHAYVMEAYEPLIPLEDLAETVYGGFQTLVHDAPTAQARVSEMLAGLDAQVDTIIDGGLSNAERGFLNVITPEALEADRLFILSNEDANAHVSFQAVGFFGAYMTVYDDAGGTYRLDSPQSYKEYMASPWKDMWTQAMIKEVDKLEDQNTWIRSLWPTRCLPAHACNSMEP